MKGVDGMSIEADIAAYNARLDAAIADTMMTDVFIAARDHILLSVFENVYDKYTPSGQNPYERRYDNGGLSDFRNIELVSSGPTANGFEIEVRDMAEGIDGEGPIDQVIESGVGYTWTESDIYKRQPYPRPFYEGAEKMMMQSGAFERALMDGLRRRGL